MKLDIREKGEIIKTYTADINDVDYGVVEDVSRIINIEELQEMTDADSMRMIGSIVKSKSADVKAVLKEIFDGVTDEELRKVRPRQIAAALYEVVLFTINDLVAGMNDAVNEKN